MDPHASDQSLQKTSPPLDPAAVNKLSSEVSAQANVLASHQLQLQCLTTLTEELVKALQSTHGTTPPVNPPAPAPLPERSTSSAQAVNPRLSLPERFDGTPDKCKGFLQQCSLFLDQQPSLYPTDISRVSFICSLLSGRALEWATEVWEGGSLSFPPLNEFLRQFREVFEHSASGKEAGEQLLALRQGKDTAADYSLTFRTLAAQTGWESGPLKLLYRKGLSAELQSELACRDEGRTLEEFINITIRLDNLLRSRRSPLASAPATVSEPEPMHIGITRLSLEERERRIRNHLCLYCGQSGHLQASCPTRPPTKSTFSVSPCPNTLMVPISLISSGVAVEMTALIDSGAAGNFIDINFANSYNLPLVTCETRLAVTALDGRPLGPGLVQFKTQVLTLKTGSLHIERICLFAIDSPQNPVILGLPWLEKHNSLRSLVLAPADISERLPILLIVTSVFDPGLPYLGTLNLCL